MDLKLVPLSEAYVIKLQAKHKESERILEKN